MLQAAAVEKLASVYVPTIVRFAEGPSPAVLITRIYAKAEQFLQVMPLMRLRASLNTGDCLGSERQGRAVSSVLCTLSGHRQRVDLNICLFYSILIL